MWALSVLMTCVIYGVCRARDPFTVIEAEFFDVNNGGLSLSDSKILTTSYMGYLEPGDILGYKGLNFSTGAIALQIHMASSISENNGRIVVRLDTRSSKPIATHVIESTGSWDRWVTATLLFMIPEERPQGIHDLYFTLEPLILKKDIINIDRFVFHAVEGTCPAPEPCPTPAPTTACPSPPPVTYPNSPESTTVTCSSSPEPTIALKYQDLNETQESQATNSTVNEKNLTIGLKPLISIPLITVLIAIKSPKFI